MFFKTKSCRQWNEYRTTITLFQKVLQVKYHTTIVNIILSLLYILGIQIPATYNKKRLMAISICILKF